MPSTCRSEATLARSILEGIKAARPALFALEQTLNLGLAHPAAEVQVHGQCLEPWPKPPFVLEGQGGQKGLTRRRRPVLLLVEAYVVGAEDNILHHNVFVALELSIWRQAGLVHGQRLVPLNLQFAFLGLLSAELGLRRSFSDE